MRTSTADATHPPCTPGCAARPPAATQVIMLRKLALVAVPMFTTSSESASTLLAVSAMLGILVIAYVMQAWEGGLCSSGPRMHKSFCFYSPASNRCIAQ